LPGGALFILSKNHTFWCGSNFNLGKKANFCFFLISFF